MVRTVTSYGKCKTTMRIDKGIPSKWHQGLYHQSNNDIMRIPSRRLLVYKYLVITLAIISSRANRV